MLDAIKKKYNDYQDARIRERVAQMNAEGAAARDAQAKAEADRLAAVSASVRGGRAERLAPPPQAGMARRAAVPMTMSGAAPGATTVQTLNGKRRAQALADQEAQMTGVPRR